MYFSDTFHLLRRLLIYADTIISVIVIHITYPTPNITSRTINIFISLTLSTSMYHDLSPPITHFIVIKFFLHIHHTFSLTYAATFWTLPLVARLVVCRATLAASVRTFQIKWEDDVTCSTQLADMSLERTGAARGDVLDPIRDHMLQQDLQLTRVYFFQVQQTVEVQALIKILPRPQLDL